MILLFLLLLLSSFYVVLTSSSSSSESSSSSSFNPNKFVSASPLIVASTCSDGIAIIVTHDDTTGEQFDSCNNDNDNGNDDEIINIEFDNNEEGKEEEEQQQDLSVEAGDNNNNETTTSLLSNFTNSVKLLPISYKGPYRIQQVGDPEYGTVLISVGWRTDSTVLFNKCRSIVSNEKQKYGSSGSASLTSDNDIQGQEQQEHDEFIRYVAKELSFYMSQCVVSDNVRSLSCVGLLCSSSNKSIYLIDSTGYYKVRAMSLGKKSNLLNNKLVHTNFYNQTKEQGMYKLLQMLLLEDKNTTTTTTTSASSSTTTRYYELAILGDNRSKKNNNNNKKKSSTTTSRIKRLLSKSDLFGIIA